MTADEDAAFADVTVITPAYQARDTIGRALESIAGQTLRPKAVVVVDDGSDDGTLAAAQSCKDHMNGVALTVIGQQNAGPGAARNRALAAAKTEFVAFLDADDEWLPEKLQRSMAYMQSGDYVLVAHDIIAIDGARQTRIECARRFRAANSPFVDLYRRGYIATSSVVARRDAVQAAGGFDETLPNAQDFALWLSLLSSPETRFTVFDEALTRYHRIPGSVTTFVERRRRCCVEIARRYMFALIEHPGLPLASLCYRIVAVHYEAVAAYRARGAFVSVLRTLVALPPCLVATTAAYFFANRPERRHSLPNPSPAARWVRIFFWLWIGVALSLYLVQFLPLVKPVLRQLGIGN